MLFKKLVFDNYKTYYGVQELQLYVPKPEEGKPHKNIVLIGGLNGAGKTTIIKAVLYTLFGKRGISEQEFKKLMANIINNNYFDEGGREASVSLTIETDFNEEWELKVKWYFGANKVMTHEEREIYIKKEGNFHKQKVLVNNIATFDRFIDKIMPYYAAPFFIFDGEEVRDLITRQDSNRMIDSIKTITGMQANEDLLKDLKKLQMNLNNKIAKASNSNEIKKIGEKLEEGKTTVEQFKKRCEQYNKKINTLDYQLEELKKIRLSKIQQNSNSRENIVKEQANLETHLKLEREELKEDFQENAMYIILSNKINNLKSRIRKEKSAKDQELLQQSSLKPYRKFMDGLLNHTITPPLTEKQIEQLQKFGEKVWIEEYSIKQTSSKPIIYLHDLTNADYSYLSNLRVLDQHSINSKINNIDKLTAKLDKVESELIDAPESVNIEKENNEIEQITRELAEIRLRYKSARNKLKSAEENYTSLANKMTRMSKADQSAEELFTQLQQVNKILAGLTKYTAQMTALKTLIVKEEFENMLRLLIRKEDEFGKIEFDLGTCTIRLYNDKMQEISIEERSAGEMQMISSALIWALTKVSALKLPMIIDTPLGRLDSYHRNHLINHYYSELSDQVIILSTDTEISNDYVNVMKKYTHKEYMLDYDQSKKYTIIRDGYFNFVKG